MASSGYNILLCSETLVSDMRHMSKLLVPGFGHPKEDIGIEEQLNEIVKGKNFALNCLS